jgi:hypothetical protein
MLLLQGDGMAFIAPIVFLFKSERKSYEIQNILKAIQTQKSSCAPEIMFLFYFQKKKEHNIYDYRQQFQGGFLSTISTQ